MILEPRKIKSDTVSTVFPSISHEVISLFRAVGVAGSPSLASECRMARVRRKARAARLTLIVLGAEQQQEQGWAEDSWVR